MLTVYEILLPDTKAQRKLALVRDRLNGCLQRIARDYPNEIAAARERAENEFDRMLASTLPDSVWDTIPT